ncbi:hypothetical protein F0U60_50510 [Archangium minus]|uniref:Uncharacterized protein n=1 Tax=Archangium minus TaxID=83450 RepID=A0ABY9X7T8_9BACT|nr:hypothetical protein F0U61_50495 [Archangium violaceum]WNG51455.1 hypothetical protein F0U60_50510 [Archangium minus]
MANHINVYITDTGISYDPSNLVSQGDIVTFHFPTSAQSVQMNFGTPSCFSSSNLSLTGGTQGPTSSLEVDMHARPGSYPFTVTTSQVALSWVEGKFRHGGNYESKNGSLDVTTEPPPPEEKDKKK